MTPTPLTPAQLRYAAYARCRCGAGLAYPIGAGLHGAWHCSAVLRDPTLNGAEHDEGRPFAFWSVKSEDEYSAKGSTTRPSGPDGEHQQHALVLARQRRDGWLAARERTRTELLDIEAAIAKAEEHVKALEAAL